MLYVMILSGRTDSPYPDGKEWGYANVTEDEEGVGGRRRGDGIHLSKVGEWTRRALLFIALLLLILL